jgi:hypothetical protein
MLFGVVTPFGCARDAHVHSFIHFIHPGDQNTFDTRYVHPTYTL